jgi:uncharacterized protein (DUF362 family)/ferredoxin
MESVFVHRARYDDESLRPAVFALLEGIGRLGIERGSRVLIKPNFLAPARPERAMTTHPLVLRAAAEYVLSKGARALVADSPGMGSFDRLIREGGYAGALKGLDVEIRPFRQTVAVDIGEPFGRIELAREAVAADLVINLPKLKTHAMMLMTLGVKNLFGCVVGLEKPRWHMRSGVSRKMFARLLVQICRAVDPAATLIDGILAMEGQGPGRSGSPRSLGFLAAGGSAPAVDLAICRLVGVEPGLLPTHAAALELGLVPPEVPIVGDPAPVEGFRLPVLGPLTFGPRRLQPLLRRHLVQRPVAELSRCRMCGECRRCCPAAAVSADAGGIRFDYDRCIRCYCCVEMCPHGALAVVETTPGVALRRLTALRDRLAARIGRRRPAPKRRVN